MNYSGINIFKRHPLDFGERMIRAIRIQNFQRIDNALQLQIGPLTVIVGENGSGKSSFMKGVHWAVRCATLVDYNGKVTLDQMDFAPSKDFTDLAHKLKLQNSAGGRKVNVTFYNSEGDETNILIGSARNDAGIIASIDGPLAAALTNNEKPSTAYIPGIAGVAEEESILAVPILHRKAASGEGGSVLRQIMLAIADAGEGTGQNYKELEELSKWVSLVLPGARFWVKFDRLRDKNITVKFLTPDMRVQGQSHSVAWKSIDMAGTGFLQVVQIFAYLLYFRPKLLLIDEPDAHLHPGRQQLLIKALAQASEAFPDTQIIISTHSPSLVRALPVGAKIHWLEDGSLKADGDVVRQRMGWNALDKDIIIFTEDGNTDCLQRVIDQWPSLSQRCAIWPTFGKDGLPNGMRARAIANKLGIKVLIHRDRDFMSNEDVAAWSALKEYDKFGVPLWVTPGSDIESVFCTREHIAATFNVGLEVAEEILAEAVGLFDSEQQMQDFAKAYDAAVQKLPGRNSIARWNDLGQVSPSTIKGKEFAKLISKASLDVLARQGLGRLIKNRDKIQSPYAGIEYCGDLREMIESVI